MKPLNKIEDKLKRLEKLPTLPGIAIKILELVRDKETSLNEIADLLSKDPSLSAEVIKAINSPFYGLPTRITSVSHAVNMLGINTVKSLALSFALIKKLRSKESSGFDYSNFWKDSLIGAVAVKILSENILPKFADDAFFLGLIHNIGILAANQCLPKQYSLVIRERERNLCAYHEAENQVLGFNHMQLGEYLAHSWGLPKEFAIPIRYHHEPDKLIAEDPNIDLITKILNLASLFIDLNNLQDKRFYMAMAQLEFSVKQYNLQDTLNIDEIAKQIHCQTMNVFPLFDIEIQEEKDYFKLIEDARNELINLSADFMQQVCEQKKLIESLSEQAMRDALTGLLNFQAFHEAMEKEVQRAKRYGLKFCLIIADIDRFKEINDNYGHLAGDYILKVFAKYLKDSLRTSDIVARYGGEEFAIILPETSKLDGMIVAERLRESIASLKIAYEDHTLSVSVSCGMSFLQPPSNAAKTDLIKEADDALYQAKNSGRNTCRCFEK